MNPLPEELQERIAAYIDGQLPPAEAARLEVFLANTDRELADRVIGMIADKHRVRLLPRTPAPRDLAARVMERVERTSLLDGLDQVAGHRWWQSRSAIAAGLAILLGGFSYIVVISVYRPTPNNPYHAIAEGPTTPAGPLAVARPPGAEKAAATDAALLAMGPRRQVESQPASPQILDQSLAKAGAPSVLPPASVAAPTPALPALDGAAAKAGAAEPQIAAAPGLSDQAAGAGGGFGGAAGGGGFAGRGGGGGGRGGRGGRAAGGFGGGGFGGAAPAGIAGGAGARALNTSNLQTIPANSESTLKALADLRKTSASEPLILTLAPRDEQDLLKLRATLAGFTALAAPANQLAPPNQAGSTASPLAANQAANQVDLRVQQQLAGNNAYAGQGAVTISGGALANNAASQANPIISNNGKVAGMPLQAEGNFEYSNNARQQAANDRLQNVAGDLKSPAVYHLWLHPDQLDALARDYPVQVVARGKDVYIARIAGEPMPPTADAANRDKLLRSLDNPAASAPAAVQLKEAPPAGTLTKAGPDNGALTEVVITVESPPPGASQTPTQR